ncbi:ylmG homolog protein 2, chloroplastic [Typha angustifolia]|uniref:ylmG homolog protein 2, chloroplastic n=1 Tax=Typha angustifolia TaxID=59011 RepID=UPI003C2D72E4
MAPLPSSDTPQSLVPFTSLLSTAFRYLPFPSPNHQSKPSVPEHTALNCFKEITTSLSDHPFLKSLLSFHSELRSFYQVRCRGVRSASFLSGRSFAAILPGDSVAGLVVANGITNFLNIYNTLLVVRLVLTWFPNSPPAIVSPLSTLCDPYLNIFRGIIPPLGGTLDLSPILAFLVLNAFTSTAAALPAELPLAELSHRSTSQFPLPLNLTTAQRKWMRRVCSKGSKKVEEAN